MFRSGDVVRRSFSATTLKRLREMPSEVALVAISTTAKVDRTFAPVKDPRTRRWHVYTERGDYEILTTDCKWYDTRTKIGGGGAIDLAMHVLGLPFVEAVKRLTASTGVDDGTGRS